MKKSMTNPHKTSQKESLNIDTQMNDRNCHKRALLNQLILARRPSRPHVTVEPWWNIVCCRRSISICCVTCGHGRGQSLCIHYSNPHCDRDSGRNRDYGSGSCGLDGHGLAYISRNRHAQLMLQRIIFFMKMKTKHPICVKS